MGPATSHPKSTLRRFLPCDMSPLPELFATSTFKHISIKMHYNFGVIFIDRSYQKLKKIVIKYITSVTSGSKGTLKSVISGFRRKADEIITLLGYYAASSGNLLQTFRDHLSVPSSDSTQGWTLDP